MEVRYYADTDTAYVYLLEAGERAKIEESEEVAPGVVVDFDANERPVEIEIYEGARAKLAGVPPDAEAAERIRREERELAFAEVRRRFEEMSHSLDEFFSEGRQRTEK